MKISRGKIFMHFLLSALIIGCHTTAGMDSKSVFSFGPVSSQITTTSAKVWLRTEFKENLQIEYSKNRDFNHSQFTELIISSSKSDFTSIHHLKHLLPDTEYFYRGVIKKRPPIYSLIGRFRTPSKEDTPFKFTVSGDTCAKYQPFDLFNKMKNKNPNFFIYLGDTICADSPLKEFHPALWHYRYKYKENRDDESLQKFLRNVPVYAIWDDHEVENNFNSSWGPKIKIARQAFREYWPVKSEEKTILYYSFSWSKLADFIILDTRQFRSKKTDRNGYTPDATMLGTKQKNWLKKKLSKSKAPFKFIISSVAFNTHRKKDKWSDFITERNEILNYIKKNKINGIIILSADLHKAIAFPKKENKIREFTVGPIAAKKNCSKKKYYESKGYFFMCDSYNYLLIDISKEAGNPSVEVKYYDEKNNLRFREKYTADE
tara:strand:- start:1079 stop:2374 length:1296 start_codon:yes stop_codon:yes gene_type:complete